VGGVTDAQRRREHLAQLEDGRRKAIAAAEHDEDEATRAEASADRKAAEREEIAELVAGGQIDEAEGARRFDEIAESERLLRKAASEKQRVAAKRRELVTQIEHEIDLARFGIALAEREPAIEGLSRELAIITKALASLEPHAVKALEFRAQIQHRDGKAVEICPDGVEMPVFDEPDFGPCPALLALLKEGPRQPTRLARERAEKAQRERERGEQNRVATVVAQASSALGRNEVQRLIEQHLPEPHLQAQAWERIEAEQAGRRRRRDADLAAFGS
jgi:hypothetical protein